MGNDASWRTAPGDPASFVLEYRLEGGRRLGEGVCERDSRLVVNSEDRAAFMEKHRSEGDEGGEPIGTFRLPLAGERLARLPALVRRVKLEEVPPPRGADLDTSLLTLAFRQGATAIEKQFISRDGETIDRLEPLLSELEAIEDELDAHPVAAVRLAVAPAPPGHGRRFELAVTNIGKTDVRLADPRALDHDERHHWAGVRIAELPEERPGFTSPPLQWSRILLMPALGEPAGGGDLILKPGQKFAAPTLQWLPMHLGVACLAQGVLSNYTGHGETDGCYRIRGALFSEFLGITAR